MANHQIKVKGIADFSAITNEVNALQKTVSQAFGKTGEKILDEDSVNALHHTAEEAFVKMNKELQKLRKESKELSKEMKKTAGDEKKSEELSRKRAENIRKIIVAEKVLKDLRKTEKNIYTGSSDQAIKVFSLDEKRKEKQEKDKAKQELVNEKMDKKKKEVFTGTATGGLKGIASELPAVSQAMSVGEAGLSAGKAASSAGMGIGAVAGLAALGVAAALAAVAVSRMAAGFEAFKEILPDVVRLAGMGVTPIHGRGNRAVQMGESFGYNEPEMLKMQEGASRAFGGTTQRGGENRLMNMMGMSRMLGLGSTEITGGGDQLRKVGGTEMAQKQMGLILEKAITSGMDKTQASAYLSSAVEMLSSINQSGTSNTNQLLSVMTDLVSSKRMSPEQAARSISGINNAIAGSSGESNAFFQMAAARQGLGGGTLLGSQFAVRQGLTGVNMGDLQNQVGGTESGKMGMKAIQEMGLGDEGFTEKFAGSILKEVSTRFNQNSKEGRAATLGFVGQMFGTKTAPEATKTLALLERISKPHASDADKKMLSELSKDPAERWRDQVLDELKSVDTNSGLIKTALETMRTEAGAKDQQIQLGEAIAPVFNTLKDTMTHLDATLTGLTTALEHSTLKDMASGLESLVESLMSALEKGIGGLVSKMLTPSFWLSSDSASGGVNQPVPPKMDPNDKAAAYKYFGMTPPAEDDAKSFATSPMGVPTKTANSMGLVEHKSTTPPPVHNVDLGEMVSEQKKTNTLLEKSMRPGGAPRAGRESSRP